MDLTGIETWLKTTIPGLVLLGAVGSIVAYWSIRGFKLLARLAMAGRRQFQKIEYQKGWKTGVVAGYIEATKDPVYSTIWFSFVLAKLIIASVAFLASLIGLLFLIQFASGNTLTLSSFVAVTACFLLGRWIFELFRDIRAIFTQFISPLQDASLRARNSKEADRLAQKDDGSHTTLTTTPKEQA